MVVQGGPEESVWKMRWVLAKDLWFLPKYRSFYIKTKRRELKMFWKYDSHIYIQKFGLVGLGLAVVVFAASRKTGALLMRLPTEDVNELLKHDAWVEERNKINLRKEQANKMLVDSSYISERNSPIK
ncbi:transmembrane protein, putative [Bodo saltans]|uniref:Transmembrane protein, putative n=1 Tax=Bodo saltans TaxID=75058 RepID=A0A0S4IXF2_BODSA|nr:transmembrane protein, putative [Bodo saltans]|eukprot:CUG06378.1 transmembrane protein, putative [Bodo saltans]